MNQLNKLIEQYTCLHDLTYAKELYRKETKRNPDRLDTEVTEYWDELDKTANFACWWMNKLKSEFRKLSEAVAFCGVEQRKFLDEVEKNFEMPNTGDKTIQHKFGESLIDGYDFEDICDPQKVIKGE